MRLVNKDGRKGSTTGVTDVERLNVSNYSAAGYPLVSFLVDVDGTHKLEWWNQHNATVYHPEES